MRRSGFSLIEIILVIALMAVAATVTIINFTAFAERGDKRSVEEIVGEAIRKARFLAASERNIAELHFDKDSGSLHIDGSGIESLAYELPPEFGEDGPATIKFYLVPSTEGLQPFERPGDTRQEAKRVRFAPDRSASPFVVEIDLNSGTPERIVYDPFSSLRRADAQ